METKNSTPSRKIALTGGPGVGKSSIIQCLQELGYAVREEVFTKLFAQAQRSGRFNEQFLHSKELIHELISAQMELETRPVSEKLLFLDRSRIDIWGFSRNMGIIPNQEDQRLLEQGTYDLVFVIEPMSEELYDQNEVRRQTYSESLEHHQANIMNTVDYLTLRGQDPGQYLIRVPFFRNGVSMSVTERTQFILQRITA